MSSLKRYLNLSVFHLVQTQKEVYNRIVKKIKELAVDPFPPDAKRVVGKKKKYSE
ncbi:MAG: hypothetical protein DDT42_01963 [candidate division WS2 bacterium]|uniref:Uncharacterized protein n=1 Tax=Psychracetigena formicireducens TaxID=2986056 RepID=A0A9E2F220_PSYF1|nr:hypothetical protein [Candidatus Psychracetigena formicireducens]